MPIDRRYLRIARRLKEADLVSGATSAFSWLGLGDPFAGHGEESDRFLGFYSSQGIRHGLEAYGIDAALRKQGLGDYTVRLISSDAYRHRMQVLHQGREDDRHRLIDLSITITRTTAGKLLGPAVPEHALEMLQVEWLGMQHPGAAFSPGRVPLPGQLFPGLGIGYTMHNIILLMARRTGRDGTLNTPERLHLAMLYARYGYRFIDPDHRDELAAIIYGTRYLPFAMVAWAAERGALYLAGEPWSYRPCMMLAPVSKRLRKLCPGVGSRLRNLMPGRSYPWVEVDLESLHHSLTTEPVPGLDPDTLLG